MAIKISRVECGDPTNLDVFKTQTGKLNKNIVMTSDDKKCHTKVYSHESYSQELFDVYTQRISTSVTHKDLRVGDSIKVKAISYTLGGSIQCESIDNGMLVIIPATEFIYDISTVTADDVFDVVVTKTDHGSFYGTCKNPQKYREELEQARIENTWFDVKVMSLIRGGYRALYKGTIECFIPGSHAAANVVVNFQELIGKTIPVMIDNYDWSSRMYVVSYKKYVKESLPVKIHEIKFGHKYTGKLTSNPTEFGLFIELENYFTGLVHGVDFENYDEISKQYRTGDVIDVYVKNITERKGNYRIVLTLNENDIDRNKLTWYRFKNTCEGKVLNYVYNKEPNNISVTIDTGENINISLPQDFNTDSLNDYPKISIYDINVLRQEIKFDFCK